MALGLGGAALRAAPFSLSQIRRFESVCGQRDQRREDELESAPPRTFVRVSQGWSTRFRGPWSQNLLSNILEIRQSFHGHIPLPHPA